MVFDVNEWPEPFYLTEISTNELNGTPNGSNAMFLAEIKPDPEDGMDRRFKRLGVGQVINQTWFNHAELMSMTLVLSYNHK